MGRTSSIARATDSSFFCMEGLWVAELTERPLCRVTCGDIGTNAEDVEGYLETVFHLGTQWNYVVLLDEADTFLEERSSADIERNALVSVFLRVLEYDEGILILTSNRIGTFDEAYKSRVQLTLHYPPLDQDRRQRIWNNFMNRLDHSGVKVYIDKLKDKVDMLSAHELNGRVIRNAIETATLLAQFRGQTLGPRHPKEVIKVSNEFEQYLAEVHGHSLSEWARAQRTRAD
ncbi:P-loop containing nucleoside triphosphate hydrolase protein [Aspergillus sergii]|uniref:P-loop containing nucleoside triphosphate hydrolase protein n=1 Tax=Aspergillus sergii TaxID=1034303 RepID=A0A5N6X3A1_9EURO|nr:P-loop containing nucleoside triphosphate hydrolase protein [Aspergillus sergii]